MRKPNAAAIILCVAALLLFGVFAGTLTGGNLKLRQVFAVFEAVSVLAACKLTFRKHSLKSKHLGPVIIGANALGLFFLGSFAGTFIPAGWDPRIKYGFGLLGSLCLIAVIVMIFIKRYSKGE